MKLQKDHKTILLDQEDLKRCKIGAGADCCIWLIAGKDFECLYYNRQVISLAGTTLEEQWKSGRTVAKRDGCDEARDFFNK